MTTSTRTRRSVLDAHRPTADEVLALDHQWYHAVDLDDGRATPGWIDLRRTLDVVDLPTDLTGLRALDVGSYDGFWAFELERRGAEVVALDADVIPPPDTPQVHRARIAAEAAGRSAGTGFATLAAHLRSSVRRVELDVYDLTADVIGGPVDLVFLGAMLLHLRNPVGALERCREVLRPGGTLVLFEPVDEKLAKDKAALARFLAWDSVWTWWYANPACLEAWARTAGFTDVRRGRQVRIQPASGPRQRMLCLTGRA